MKSFYIRVHVVLLAIAVCFLGLAALSAYEMQTILTIVDADTFEDELGRCQSCEPWEKTINYLGRVHGVDRRRLDGPSVR